MILLSETTIVSSFVAENQSCQDKDIGNQKPKTEIEIECPVLFLWLCSSCFAYCLKRQEPLAVQIYV